MSCTVLASEFGLLIPERSKYLREPMVKDILRELMREWALSLLLVVRKRWWGDWRRGGYGNREDKEDEREASLSMVL